MRDIILFSKGDLVSFYYCVELRMGKVIAGPDYELDYPVQLSEAKSCLWKGYEDLTLVSRKCKR